MLYKLGLYHLIVEEVIQKLNKEFNGITVPGPSVQGPPTKAIILAPVPGKQAPSNPAATFKATPVHLEALCPACTGH